MLNFSLKKFCQKTIISFKNINTLNELVSYTMANYEIFSSKDFVNVFKVFENLKPNEQEYKIKFYEIIDYAFHNEKNFSDLEYIKSLLELFSINQIKDEVYLDYIVNQTINRNIRIFQNTSEFCFFINKFSQLDSKNETLWNIFEDAFFELRSNFSKEEIVMIIKFMISKKRGSRKFIEFYLNYLNHNETLEKNQNIFEIMGILMQNLDDFYDKSQKELAIKFINKKISLLISDEINIEVMSLIFPSFLKVNKSNIELDIENISYLSNKYLDQINNNLNNLSVERITNLINELYQFNYDKINKNNIKNCFLQSQKTNSFQNNLLFLKYLSLFPDLKNDTEIGNIFSDDLFWEDSIEEFNNFSLNDEITLFEMLVHYEVKYPRIWIILQTSLKKKLANSRDINKVEYVMNLIKENLEKESETYSDNLIFQPFVYFLNTLHDKLIIERSHLMNVAKI